VAVSGTDRKNARVIEAAGLGNLAILVVAVKQMREIAELDFEPNKAENGFQGVAANCLFGSYRSSLV
jgi:hypothetical protein